MKKIEYNNSHLIIGVVFLTIGFFLDYLFSINNYGLSSIKIALYIFYCFGLIGISGKIRNVMHPLFIGLILISIGLIIQYFYNYYIVKKYLYYYKPSHILNPRHLSDSFYIVGGYNIIEGVYYFPLKNIIEKPFQNIFKFFITFFQYINSLKITKFFKTINVIIILPVIIGIIVGIYFVPRILYRFEVKNAEKLAYAKMVYALNYDESTNVRKAAVLGIGNIGDKQSLNLLTDTITKQPELASLISEFVKNEKDRNNDTVDIDNRTLLFKLKDVYEEKDLQEKDYQQRLIYEINECMDEIRSLRKWFKEDLEMSVEEKEYVTKIGMLNNIDSAIKRLNEIALKNTDYKMKDNYDFFVMSDKLNSEIQSFIKSSDKIMKSFEKKSDNIMFLNKFNKKLSDYEKQITYEKRNKYQITIEKYVAIIKSLVKSGKNDTIKELENIVTNSEIAFSIRLQSIWALGVIGKEKQLGTLIKVSEDDDPLIRSYSLIAISMILTDTRDIEGFDPYYFDFDSDSGGADGGF
jgi:hypothetical protein